MCSPLVSLSFFFRSFNLSIGLFHLDFALFYRFAWENISSSKTFSYHDFKVQIDAFEYSFESFEFPLVFYISSSTLLRCCCLSTNRLFRIVLVFVTQHTSSSLFFLFIFFNVLRSFCDCKCDDLNRYLFQNDCIDDK